MATPAEYDLVSSALVKLGLPPLQVLLEASVAEVTLTDALNFGLQFYFQAGSQNQFFRTSGTSPTPAPAIETTLSGHSELRIMEDAHAAASR